MNEKILLLVFLTLTLLGTSCAPAIEPVIVERALSPTPFPAPSLTSLPAPSRTPTPALTAVPATLSAARPTLTPVRPPITPTPLNPETDMRTWPLFYDESSRFSFNYYPTWTLNESEGAIRLHTGQGSSAQLDYLVTITDIPNPDNRALDALLAEGLLTGFPPDTPLEPATLASVPAQRAVLSTAVDSALVYWLAGNGRFLEFRLEPFSAGQPLPGQYTLVLLFEGMVATAQLDSDRPASDQLAAGQSDGRSTNPLISSDGQLVAFLSSGRLTSQTGNEGLSVFVRDTSIRVTQLIDVTLDGTDSDRDIYGLAMSADGQVIAYYAFAGDIVAGDELDCGSEAAPISCEDLFVHDRRTGNTTRLPLGRPQGLGADYSLALSADGRLVAYGHEDNLWIYDRETGETEPQLSGINDGGANGPVFAPQFGGNGRYLAFVTRASNLHVSDNDTWHDVYVLDRESGRLERISRSVESDGPDGDSGMLAGAEGFNGAVAISADGRFVAFASQATNLTSAPRNECPDIFQGGFRTCYEIFLFDRQLETMTRITDESDGDSYAPRLSADGRFLSFTSTASNLTFQSGLPCIDRSVDYGCPAVHLYDALTGEISYASMGSEQIPANGSTFNGDLSADGRFLVFTSNANNLVPGDNNNASDIFRLDRQTGEIVRVSLKNP